MILFLTILLSFEYLYNRVPNYYSNLFFESWLETLRDKLRTEGDGANAVTCLTNSSLENDHKQKNLTKCAQ